MIREPAPGSIVNVGSTSSHGAQTELTAYAMSKGALAIMTKNLAFGLMRHGIRVNQVNPGWMDSESEHPTQTVYEGRPRLAGACRGRSADGRLVKPWEVANLDRVCLSDESGVLTANCIDVDQSVHGAGEPPIPGVADTSRLDFI